MERESTDRVTLREALRERTRGAPTGPIRRPARTPDAETLGQVVQFGLQRLDEAADALCAVDTHSILLRDALAYVQRLEHGAWMPSVAFALRTSGAPKDQLADWLTVVRNLYVAFWRGVVAVPSAVALWGTALGDPPTPRSINRWLRAHFGDGAAPDLGQTPLKEPWEWAGAAADTVEALWRRAPAGDRVPDVWAARRTALWQRGACAPEALFVLAVADDLPASSVHAMPHEAMITRTAVLYAAERLPDDGRYHLRVVCHASSTMALAPVRHSTNGTTEHEDDDGAQIFVATDAETMLAPLDMPSSVPWTPVEAAWRWLASIAADDRPAVGLISSLLAPPAASTISSDHLSRGRLLAEAVRAAIPDDPRTHVTHAVAVDIHGSHNQPPFPFLF
ncbi:hypothetical protein TW95_gp1184 [Pandoravirus inopinatum]|uniref:Uncharacterized protein n=1 Tax=Pandoravirus inopinatum TaxID=1605721 RepID=A0A0B5IYG3_9VIRU|nr:hypothetical protein TW95_gp1184 [Pandoravirus inopinatum]AJF97918.1 hypothetical protein [Pandoravirus inopinatum]